MKKHQGSQESTFKNLQTCSQSNIVSLSHKHSLTHRNDPSRSGPVECGKMPHREATIYYLPFLQPHSMTCSLITSSFVALYKPDLCLECCPSLPSFNILSLQWTPSGLNADANTDCRAFLQMGVSSVSFSYHLDTSVGLSQRQLKGDYVQH